MNSKEFFNLCAQEYDSVYYSAENTENKDIAQHLTNIIEQNKVESIIEFGCGNGYWLLLSASIGVQRILGIDQSVAMLSVAKSKLINYPFVEVLESDITQQMQFESLFDMAIISFVLSVIESCRLDCVIDNVSKSLRRNGLLFMVENKQPSLSANDVCKLTICEHWGGAKYDVTYHLYSCTFLCHKLEEYGFRIIEPIDINSDIYCLVAQKK
ncbi:MAG: class I SAM-dependent methyltransferase [Acetatifactor sp.]|nr:class I SAM-dependent methyltransferase [Acetatifactor sp.]